MSGFVYKVVYNDGRAAEYRTAETMDEVQELEKSFQSQGSSVAEYIQYAQMAHRVRTETWVEK